jgi:hypothetical protein
VLRAGEEDLIRDLVAVVQDRQTSPSVRQVAVAALPRLPVEQKTEIVEALTPVFYDPDEKSDLLRVPIARLLYLWGGDKQALAYLEMVATQSRLDEARFDASMVLLEVGKEEVGATELLRLAQRPDADDVVRCAAARALGLWATGDGDVARSLAEIARDTGLEPNVRESAFASVRAILA